MTLPNERAFDMQQLVTRPPYETLDEILRRIEMTIEAMRKFAAPPSGHERYPLRYKVGEVAKMFGVHPTTVSRLGDELGFVMAPGQTQRNYSPAEIRRMRQLRRIGLPPLGRRPFILCIANQKGGVGKTTSAELLSQDLASRGYKILLIDADPQSSSTASMLLRKDGKLYSEGQLDIEMDDTIGAIMSGVENEIRNLILGTHWENIDIIPSSPDLSEAFLEIIAHLRKPDSQPWDNTHKALRQLTTNEYDLVIIDTTPSLSLDTIQFALTADGWLVPLPARSLDIESAKSMIRILSIWVPTLQKEYGHSMRWIRFLFSQRNMTSAYEGRNEKLLRKTLGGLMVTKVVPLLEALKRGAANAPTVFEVQPKTPKSYAASARSARRRLQPVTSEVLALIAQDWKGD